MENLESTIKRIEQRNIARLKSPWICNGCEKEQPPPPIELGLCKSCEKKALAGAKESRRFAIPSLLVKYGVPTALAKYDDPLDGNAWMLEYSQPNARGLYLYGSTGSGKSVVSVLVIKDWLRCWAMQDQIKTEHVDKEWRFIGCAAFVMQLQEAWRDGSEESAFRILRRYAETPHLVIDDLGTEKATDFVKQSIYFLINEREAWERQTIITSNFPLEAIDEQYDQRISSRIIGMCDVRSTKGKDRRVEK